MRRTSVVLLIAIPFLLGIWIGSRFIGEAPQPPPSDPSVPAVAASYADSSAGRIGESRQNAITRAVASASGAVVGITVTEVQRYRDPWSSDPWFRYFFGDRVYEQEVKGLGSGFLISNDGYILTNDHVAGNAKEITVTLTNKVKYSAKLVGTDQVTDIALLKIDGSNFPSIRLGNSDDVLIGEWAIAMGNPFGLFDVSDKPTVTVGVVSATGMNLSAQEGRYYRGMIQTDAAINQGNSGGPLLNSVGEAIGINSVIFTPNQGNIGLGFAIPINRVRQVVAELKAHGKIERDTWTGLEVQTVNQRLARYFGLDKAEGVIVSDVYRNSPASRSGLRQGDVIIEANGEQVANEESLNAVVTDSRPGDVLHLKVLREKKTMSIDLKLEKRPS